jgi:hypothetical protein
MPRETAVGDDRQAERRRKFVEAFFQKITAQEHALADPQTLADATKYFRINPEAVRDEERRQLVKIYLEATRNRYIQSILASPHTALGDSPIALIRAGNIDMVYFTLGFHLR